MFRKSSAYLNSALTTFKEAKIYRQMFSLIFFALKI